MNENEWLADSFEEHRAHLPAVAYRMLGSLAEAEDAVQDTWLRLSRSKADEVENLGGWLTMIIARVCLNMLRSRNTRREESFGESLPDPIISTDREFQPEAAALLADSVSIALLVVLDTLTPTEKLAFVLHDILVAIRGDRTHGRSNPYGGKAAREPGTTPRGGRRYTGDGHRSHSSTSRGRRILSSSA